MKARRCPHGVPLTQECSVCIDHAEAARDDPPYDDRGEKEYEKWLTDLSNKW